MSRICIIKNALDASEHEVIESSNALDVFLNVRKTHPQAKIYKGNPCPESDVTPTLDNKESITRLITEQGEYNIVCYAGDIISAVNYVTAKILGAAIEAIIPVPSYNAGKSTGSSNNNLSNPENTQRIKERIPYIIGTVKAIPDLYAPTYRHFVDGTEVEELFMCLCENPVQVSDFREGDTPVAEITGKSVTAYGLGQAVNGSENIFKVGDTFTDAPVITKQNNSIDGQTLIPPNSTRIDRTDIYFAYPNQIKTLNATNDFNKFSVGETVTIEGANYGIADLLVTGSVNIDYLTQTLNLTSSQTVVDYQNFRKINVTAMLVTDPVNGQLDLAGLYDIDTITYSGGVYSIKLLNAVNTNSNFANLTADATTTMSASLTANTANIFLDGTYTISGISAPTKTMTLATPSAINSDWDKLAGLTGQQTTAGAIKLRGGQNNYVGWFTINSNEATGLLLNFKAQSGIYKGSSSRTVSITVEYQQVIGNTPTGQIYTRSITMQGKPSSRDAVGASLWIDLPFSGAVRFRARRTNDNGDAADLVDETKFYQAFAYHRLEKLTYDNRALIRTRTVATQAATSQKARQLNCIATALVYTYDSGVKSATRLPTRNIADSTIDLALHPKIGRRTESEIDFMRIYQVVEDIIQYFGSDRMAKFNYTLDDTNTSFEEMMRMISNATCTNDRRVNRKIYYDLEREDNAPIILFNHRNKKAQSESRTTELKLKNDGVELTYVDSDAGWVEKTIKVPNQLITNPKKIEGTGIVFLEQAHIVAWREWNKTKFSRTISNFTGYCESDLVFRGDCVLNTDDTRPDNVTSGEVEEWNGLVIKGSQPFNVSSGDVIHLQLKTGVIDSMPVSQGEDEFHFVLSRPPFESLITTGEVKTLYTIASESKSTQQRFIVSSKNPTSNTFENELTLSNYDSRFYRNDKDIINDII